LQREYGRTAGLAEDQAGDTVAAYTDFLERYLNYRLKVLEAESIGISSDPATVAEIDGYRRQYARPYLLDRAVLDPLVKLLYARQQESVDVSHILLQVPPDAAPEDTLASFEKLLAIADSIRSGSDFGEMAARHSQDPSASAPRPGPGYRGRLGFISGGVTVRPFEDAAYATGVGELSPIVRTRFGYHLLKVHDRRMTPADIRISHIMITPQGPTAEDSLVAHARVDSVVSMLKRGGDYAALAAAFSDDKQSGANGGDLGFIPFNSRFVQEMKDVAFGMTEIGQVSDPVETQYGFHVIKLTERKPRPSLEDSYDDLKQQASRLPDATAREQAFADSMLSVRGASVDSLLVDSELARMPPDSLANMTDFPAEWRTKSVATIADSSYTLANLVSRAPWSRYSSGGGDDAGIRRTAIRDYMRDRAIDYEMSALEKTDADFARTVKEFRNGILLFTLMEDSVWTAAAEDTVALEALYNENPDAHTFPDRHIVVGVYSRSIDLVNSAVAMIKDGLPPADAVDSLRTQGVVQVDTTYIAEASNSVYDRALTQTRGVFAEPIAHNNGFVALLNAGVDAARTKTFSESRAELVNTLQERLEQQLVDRLRRKYSAYSYPDRLRSLLQDATIAEPDSVK
jgi:peptidyl-prolyl cis-trans isomerase SurA